MKKLLFSLSFIALSFNLFSQDSIYVRTLIDSLTSLNMFGRGYVNNGDKKAANFIANEFKKINAKGFDLKNYQQPVTFPINTFPENMEVKIDDSVLTNFYDYKITTSSIGSKGTFDIEEIQIGKIKTIEKLKSYVQNHDFSNKFLFIDLTKISEKKQKSKSYSTVMEIIDALPYQDIFGAKGVIIATTKLDAQGMWSQDPINTTVLHVLRLKMNKKPKKITVDIDQKFYPKFTSQNVISYIEGAVQPDTFIVFSAHYDHLGCLGSKTYFPGANDNASGVVTIIDLARYFSKPENKPYYSIAFIAFTGEEAGLLGSKYYTEKPLFPLSNIKFLCNLDMVGTGDEGITVVNATVNPKIYQQLDTLNKINGFLTKVASRGEAANSDHHFFYKAGVPAIFIYGMGKSGPYHHPEDNQANLTLKGYVPLFKLLTTFVKNFR
jgi:hypothetical protein